MPICGAAACDTPGGNRARAPSAETVARGMARHVALPPFSADARASGGVPAVGRAANARRT